MKKRKAQRGSDWRAWLRRGGLAGALALPLAPGRAQACHETPSDQYPYPATFGINIGIAFAPQVRFAYGVDVRLGQGPVAGFARLEGRGATMLRLSGGLQMLGPSVIGETGLAFQTGRRNSDIAASSGIHLGGAAWSGIAGAQLEGTMPFGGDRRNYDVAFAGLIMPFNICPAGGRLLRSGASAVVPIAERTSEATRDPGARSHDAAALERAWIEAAQAEYASVWAFLRMARELTALGAPEALAEAAYAAADDEIRHADACVALSRAGFFLRPLSARAASPRWRTRSPEAFAAIAREAWLDGCLGEGIAATQAGEAAGACRDPQTASAHATIARDERRHAELAWRVLHWAWEAGGRSTRDAVMAAVEEPRPAAAPGIAADLARDWLEAHGWPGPPAQRGAADAETARALTRLARLGAGA